MSRPSANMLADGILKYLQTEEALEALPEIIERLQRELALEQPITIISSEALSPADAKELSKKATTAWGNHPVTLLVDEALLSGFILRFRDQLIDLSGRGRLTQLQTSLS